MKRASQTVCGTLAALLFLAPSPLTAGAVSQTDGSVDPTYQADVTGTGTINAAFDLADGRTLLVGDFTSFQGVPAGGVVRIKADGSLDQSFLLPMVSGTVSAVTIGPGGGIIIGGNFSAVNGQPATNIAQLQFDGSFDPSFVTGTGFNGPVRALRLISGAALGFRVCVGGSFTTYNGMATGSLVVLTVYGSIDPSFTALVEGSVAGSVGTVSAIDTQSDGSVVIGGGFRRV